ncbi:MAG: nucleoside deaminase [Dysgonamonadaceae bacterium]|jgi:tRNA(adenine34) deaminase|nr:nucleoside deaminase [Dysgonamonadaceae bacterium]
MPEFLDDEYFMKQALAEAAQALRKDEIPVGAVIVCQKQIIARAHNLTETLNDVTAHAEMQAITSATTTLGGKYLTDCTIYVTLEPCPMCAGALAWAQIARIVYAASDPKRGYNAIAKNIPHPKTQVSCGILAKEAALMMKIFFENKRIRAQSINRLNKPS